MEVGGRNLRVVGTTVGVGPEVLIRTSRLVLKL